VGAIPSVQPGVACCGRDGRTPRNFIPVCEQFRLLQCSAAKPQRIGVRPSPASPGAATLGAWRCGSNPERPARRRLLRPGRPHSPRNFIPACEQFRLLSAARRSRNGSECARPRAQQRWEPGGVGAIPSVQPGVACYGRDGRTPRISSQPAKNFDCCSAARRSRNQKNSASVGEEGARWSERNRSRGNERAVLGAIESAPQGRSTAFMSRRNGAAASSQRPGNTRLLSSPSESGAIS
jgi:hypothetical protein